MSVLYLAGIFVLGYLLTRVTEWWHTGTYEAPGLLVMAGAAGLWWLLRGKKK